MPLENLRNIKEPGIRNLVKHIMRMRGTGQCLFLGTTDYLHDTQKPLLNTSYSKQEKRNLEFLHLTIVPLEFNCGKNYHQTYIFRVVVCR